MKPGKIPRRFDEAMNASLRNAEGTKVLFVQPHRENGAPVCVCCSLGVPKPQVEDGNPYFCSLGCAKRFALFFAERVVFQGDEIKTWDSIRRLGGKQL